MAFLGKERLLTKMELAIEKVEFANGDYVFVREMTGKERNTFEKSIVKQEKDRQGTIQFVQKLDNFRSKMAVCTVCDEKGKLLFTANDVDKLSESISAAMLDVITSAAQKLNGISVEAKEEIIKN